MLAASAEALLQSRYPVILSFGFTQSLVRVHASHYLVTVVYARAGGKKSTTARMLRIYLPHINEKLARPYKHQ